MGYCVIGLDNPKFDINVGSAMRAAKCYGVNHVVMSGRRVKSGRTDTMNAVKDIPLIRTDNLHKMIPYNCVPIAVDLVFDAIPLQDFGHPQRGFYIFGAEDATLGKRILSWCKHKIYIPTDGCMNLAATINVVLYDRMIKLEEQNH